MPVSVDERKAATAIVQSVERLERVGIYAATVIGRRAHRSAVAAYRRGRDPKAVVRATIAALAPLLTDAMIVGYLNGIWRLFLLAKLRRRSLAISFTTSVYRRQLRVLVRRTNLPQEQLEALEKNYGTVANKVTTKISQTVNRKLGAAIAESKRRGEHLKEGVQRLTEAFTGAGVTPLKSHQLEAVFRTQTQMANNAGAWLADQDPDIQKILWGYKYITVGDDRVRPEHAAMDGITLPKDDPFWEENYPSNGWNCRCQVIQLFEEEPIVRPPTDFRDLDGNIVEPRADEGFRFHPGQAFKSTQGIAGKVPAGKLPLPKIKIPQLPPKPSVVRAKAKAATERVLKTKRPRLPATPKPKQAVITPIKPTRPPAIDISGWPKPKKVKKLGAKVSKPVTVPKVTPAKQAATKTVKSVPVTKPPTMEEIQRLFPKPLPKPKLTPKPKTTRPAPARPQVSQKQWEASLTSGEREAITEFTGGEYTDIRKFQREGKAALRLQGYDAEDLRELGRWVKDLDAAYEKSGKYVGTVHRGFIARPDRAQQLGKVGNKIEIKAWTSTSVSESVAKDFVPSAAKAQGRARILMHMEVYEDGMELGGTAIQTWEKEVMLRKGTKFKVTKVIAPTESGGVTEVFLSAA